MSKELKNKIQELDEENNGLCEQLDALTSQFWKLQEEYEALENNILEIGSMEELVDLQEVLLGEDLTSLRNNNNQELEALKQRVEMVENALQLIGAVGLAVKDTQEE